jgi:tetratricopeptide (TPR) repeat protein
MGCIAGLVFAGSVFARQNSFEAHIRAGSEERQSGNYSAAMADLQAAISLDAKNVEGWYELGLLLGQIGDFRGAESAFRKAIQIEPDSAMAHYNLALTLVANPQSKLDWPGAIKELREAIRYQVDYAEAHNLLGAGLTHQADYDEAIIELRRAVQLKPSLSEAHLNLGIALEKKGMLEQAASQYQSALQSKKAFPEAATALGKILFRMGKSDEAEQQLEAALILNPDSADATHALASALQSQGKQREARIQLSIAQDLSARSSDAMRSVELSNAGLALASQGEFTKATDTLRKAIVLKPDYGIPHYNLGLILADQSDFDGAFHELVKAISLMPGAAKPWLQICRVQHARGEIEYAIESCRWASRLSPSDQETKEELKSLFSSAGPSSLQVFSQVSTVQPEFGASSDSEEAHLQFAHKLLTQNDLLGAIGELDRALSLDPGSLADRRQLATTYAASGDRDRAILEDYKILRAAPRDVATRFALGRSLAARGDTGDAVEEFKIALTYNPDSMPIRAALDRAMASNPPNRQ